MRKRGMTSLWVIAKHCRAAFNAARQYYFYDIQFGYPSFRTASSAASVALLAGAILSACPHEDCLAALKISEI